MIPDRFVHEDLQQDVIIELLAQQTELIEQEDQLGINPTLGVIIEDCIDQKVDDKPVFLPLIYSNRTYRVCSSVMIPVWSEFFTLVVISSACASLPANGSRACTLVCDPTPT